jgi:hypothetical protein
MRFAKFLVVSCSVALLAGALSHVPAANCVNAAYSQLLADGGAPLPQPPLIADGGAPLPQPPLVADGGAPLPQPPLVADGGAPLPQPPLVAIAA